MKGALPLFSWVFGDPADHVDRVRSMRGRLEEAERVEKERHRIKQSRKWRKLLKQAKSRQLKGQK